MLLHPLIHTSSFSLSPSLAVACTSEACQPFTPPPTCIGNTALQFYGETCTVNNTCETTLGAAELCHFGCMDGACLPGTSFYKYFKSFESHLFPNLECNQTACVHSAPAPICVDGVLLSYTASCNDVNVCVRETLAENCPFGCENANCLSKEHPFFLPPPCFLSLTHTLFFSRLCRLHCCIL